MIDDIVKFRSLSKEEQEEKIIKYKNLSNDEKTMLSVKINLSENDFLTQKYFDFLQDIDDYNAKQEKKNNKKRH